MPNCKKMTSFYYHDQNPSGFCFLVQILNMKGKTKRILVMVVKKMTPSCKWPSQKMPIYSEAKCEANDMKIDFIFNSHANKTHFHKKGFFISKSFWNSQITCFKREYFILSCLF